MDLGVAAGRSTVEESLDIWVLVTLSFLDVVEVTISTTSSVKSVVTALVPAHPTTNKKANKPRSDRIEIMNPKRDSRLLFLPPR